MFWVPKEARWSHLQANAKQPTIGKLIDDAMAAIEEANPGLKGVLPKDYNRPALDKVMLGELIDLISGIAMGEPGDKAKDILGRVYEYFLGGFAGSEGKRGGEFYTPRSVVRVLVEMLEPYKGRVYDPCCGSGGMFVQSEKFVESHGGRIGDIAIYGQEIELHDVAARQDEPRGARHRRRHPLEQRGQLSQGRTQGPALRLRPRQSAFQYFGLGRRAAARGCALDLRRAAGRQRQLRLAPAYPLAPRAERHGGRGAGEWLHVVGAIGRGRRSARRWSRPTWSTAWSRCRASFSTRRKFRPACGSSPATRSRGGKLRDRRGEVLFIDARKLGRLVDRTRKEFSDDDIAKIAGVYHAWRAREAGDYEDVPGFCKSAKLDEIRGHNHVLTPGRYVGAADVEDDDVPFQERFAALASQLEVSSSGMERIGMALRKSRSDSEARRFA